MSKFNNFIRCTLLLAFCFLCGCEKENQNASSIMDKSLSNACDFEMPSVIDSILTFLSISDYESFIEYFSPETEGFDDVLFQECLMYLQNLEYISLYQYKLSQNSYYQNIIDSLYCSDFIQNMLNSSHLVRIGNYIFKICKETETVYVLPINYISELPILRNENIENIGNTHILAFSTEDDVFEELEELELIQGLQSNGQFHQKARCGEDGCAGTGLSGIRDGVVTGRTTDNELLMLDAVAKYLKFGIYFEISASADWMYHPSLVYSTENPTVVADCTFKRKCKNLIVLSTRVKTENHNNGHVRNLIYSCARPLSKISLHVYAYGYMGIIYSQTPVVSFVRNLPN